MEEIERPQPKRRMYSEQEARQILDRAMGLEAQERDFSREHLEQMARDLGISSDQLQLAEEHWLAAQEGEGKRRALIAKQLREFKSHLVAYLVVNSFLFLLYLFAFVVMHGDVFPWFIFPLLGWGIAVALHAWNTYQPEGDEFHHRQLFDGVGDLD